MSYYFDTNICIYALKGRYPSIERHLKRTGPNQVFIPSIVKAELLFGAEKSEDPEGTRKTVDQFLLPYEVHSFDDAAAENYAKIRGELEKTGEPIGPNDLIIASTVTARNGTLITRNVDEFRRVEHLQIEDWTKSNHG